MKLNVSATDADFEGKENFRHLNLYLGHDLIEFLQVLNGQQLDDEHALEQAVGLLLQSGLRAWINDYEARQANMA